MIPTLILAGLVVGRWWFVPVAAVAFPAVLIVGDVGSASNFALALGGGVFGAANTAAGVAVHRMALALLRALRRFWADPIGSVGGGS